jgi:hypothetical protein
MRWGKIVLGLASATRLLSAPVCSRGAVLDKAPGLQSLSLLIRRRRHDKKSSERDGMYTCYGPELLRAPSSIVW